MVRSRPCPRCFKALAVLCLAVDPRDAADATVAELHAAANTNARAPAGGEYSKLASRTSLEAPRGAEGIRRRLDPSGARASSVDGRLEVAEVPAHHGGLESQDHHESWIDALTSPDDTYRLGEALYNPISYRGSGENMQPEELRDAAPDEEARNKPPPLPPTEDDLVDSGRRTPSVRGGYGDEQYGTSVRTESDGNKSSVTEDGVGLSITDCGTNSSCEATFGPQLNHDPWEGYEIVAQADPVASWEILREARLSYYTFKHDRKKGRRQLGVLPTEVATFLPEAFSTFTLPVLLPDGSRSRVEGVPNIDWTYLFAHTLVVTQELNRRYGALDVKMDVLKAEAQNASLKLVRFLEEQGKEWQTAAILREVAFLSEMKRNIVKHKVLSGKAAGRERRTWHERRHNQTWAIAETELEHATILAAESASLGIQRLQEEERGMQKAIDQEESLRMSAETDLLSVDMEAANQTARLSCNRRLSENLATLRATKDAEREGEAADMIRIRAKGAEARKQAQAVIDETSTFVGSLVLSALSDPAKLVRIMAALLGIAFVGLSVGNAVTLAATTIRRRVTKPRLIRETDLPSSPLAAAAAWVARRAHALLMTLVGESNRCTSGVNPSSAEALKGVVLPPSVEQRMRVIATSIRSSYSRGAPLPHVLIHGAPGSGKSVLARRMATMCGLNTVVVAGGDVGSLGRTASAELSGLMTWAGGGVVGGGGGLRRPGRGGGRRGKGVVVVMDEAEAALGDRRKGTMSENARSALNAVLLCTGELRPGFLMVLTTSRPQDLDEAVLDRVDEVVHLPRPGLAERARLIRLYYSIYLHHDPPSDFLRGRAAPAATAVGAAGQGETAGHRESVVTISGHTHIAHVEGHKRSSTGCGSTKNDIDSSASTTESNTDDDNNNAVGKKSPEAGADTTPAVTSQQQPDLQGHRDAEKRPSVWSRIFDKKKRGGADSDGGLGVVKISEGFKRKAPRLMAMLAVRSEGFYGRDMAHLFSAVQAAVFGSEDCSLTERLWARTERQKLAEFSEKVILTGAVPTTPTTVAASRTPANAASKGSATTVVEASLTPPLPKRRAHVPAVQTSTGASIPSTDSDAKAEKDLPVASGVKQFSVDAFGTGFGAKTAAPCYSGSVSGNRGGSGGAASNLTVLSEGGRHGRFAERGQGVSDAGDDAGDAAVFAAISSGLSRAELRASAASDKEEEEEVELELESVEWVGGAEDALSSPPCDPEITRPERFVG